MLTQFLNLNELTYDIYYANRTGQASCKQGTDKFTFTHRLKLKYACMPL